MRNTILSINIISSYLLSIAFDIAALVEIWKNGFSDRALLLLIAGTVIYITAKVRELEVRK